MAANITQDNMSQKIMHNSVKTYIGLLQKNREGGSGGGRGERVGGGNGISKGQIKKKWKFQGCSRKTNAELPRVLVVDFGISKGCHTNLQNFQG